MYSSYLLCPTAILLGSLKVPYEELKRRIVEMDEELLTAQIIEQLLKFMPEPEQLSQLAQLKDQYDELSEPEQFCVMVGKQGAYQVLRKP